MRPEFSQKNFAEAVNLAIWEEMAEDESVVVYGLGVNDPKGVFGTTTGLEQAFGSSRVFETPTSENAMLGVGVGMAISGLKPIHVHQRMDFFLLAMDQLVNSAAKWRFMFGGRYKVPITIRLIVGRGWGQGPTHSQDFSSWFARVPGLKVSIPATVSDAYNLMRSAIQDPNPVIFVEHRWLHGQIGDIREKEVSDLGEAEILRKGQDVTVVGAGHLVIESMLAASKLEKLGVTVEVVNLRSIRPFDLSTVVSSVRKTGRLVVADSESSTGSFSAEIAYQVYDTLINTLRHRIVRLSPPDYPEPTAFNLTRGYHVTAERVIEEIGKMLSMDVSAITGETPGPHDVPGKWFSGPF